MKRHRIDHVRLCRAQRQPIPLQKSPRYRLPAKRYNVLRRVRAGRIAKPKATSGSDPTIDTPRVQSAKRGSWRAAQVARGLRAHGRHLSTGIGDSNQKPSLHRA